MAGPEPMQRAVYVAFDGPDGVGKSTLVALAASRWAQTGNGTVARMAEPDRNGPLWELIRDHRLDGRYPERSWLLIIAAASLAVQTRGGGVLENIQSGTSVVVDRSFLSVLAHYWDVSDETLRCALASMFVAPDLLVAMRPASLGLLEGRLRLRGEDEESIEMTTRNAWRYAAAADWLVQHGWALKVLDSNEHVSPEQLWEQVLPWVAAIRTR